MSTLLAIIIVLVLWGLLFVLSIAESSLIGMTRSRAEALAEEQVPGADKLVAALADRGKLLAPCLLYTSPSPRDGLLSRMPSSA